MAVLLAMIGLTASYALVLGFFGDPDWGPVYSGYLGLILLAGALVSIGLAISALTANQIVAAVVSLGIFGLLWTIDSLGGAAAGADRQLVPRRCRCWRASRRSPTGAMYTSDFGFFLALDLLGLFLDSARAGAALKRWSTMRSSSSRCSGSPAGWWPSWCCSAAALRLPLQTRLGRWRGWLYAGVVVAAVGVCALANVALTLHDAHIDLTREKIYTPSRPRCGSSTRSTATVAVTYFYHSRDRPADAHARHPRGHGRRNPLLQAPRGRPRQGADARPHPASDLQRGDARGRGPPRAGAEHRRGRDRASASSACCASA